MIRSLIAGSFSLVAACAHAAAPPNATYTDIHNFNAKVTGPTGSLQYDGSTPGGQVAFDGSGNLYGTTPTGGSASGGTIWEMTSAGVYKILHNFGGTISTSSPSFGVGILGPIADSNLHKDGSDPEGRLTFDSAGNLYGTTNTGGSEGSGMVWEITKTGSYVDLHDFGSSGITSSSGFSCQDGVNPAAGVTVDSSGNLFGTTVLGGASGKGLVWELPAGGTYSDLHDFSGSGSDGANPYGEVTFDSTGNMYGTAANGGLNGGGVLWELPLSGTFQDLHDFQAAESFNPDGTSPMGAVVIDSSNNIFGTTASDAEDGFGTFWKYASGQEHVLEYFGELVLTQSNGITGVGSPYPGSGVTMDSAGNVFGVAQGSASAGASGMVWESRSSGGRIVDLHDFGGNVSNVTGGSVTDGKLPIGGIALDQYGNLYGTASTGGSAKGGTVWAIGSLGSVSLAPSTVGAGVKVLGTVNLGMAAPIGGTLVNLSGSDPNAAPPATIKIPAGATSGTFEIGTARLTSSDSVTITASQMYASVTSTLAINPVTISGFSYYPTPKENTSAKINVDLTGPAPTGGLEVSLFTVSPSAFVLNPSFRIPAGATSATFQISYFTVSVPTSITFTASINGNNVSLTPNITIEP